MSPSPSPPFASFLVGDFLVAPDRNELRQLDPATGRPSGEPIKLTSKQMDVLVTLAAKAGQPVSKNELFDAVWPGVTVGEDNISSCIYELRKAFGAPYIQTVRNRGYLLAARVERDLPPGLLEALEPPRHEFSENLLAGPAVPQPPPAPPPPPVRTLPPAFDRQTRRKLLVAFGALALVFVLGLYWLYYQGTFIVDLDEVINLTADPSLEDVADTLRNRFFADLQDPNANYKVSEIGLFAATTVEMSIEPAADGQQYQLVARIRDRGTQKPTEIHFYARKEGLGRVGGLLIESIRRELESRACRMNSSDSLRKADHCYRAGERFVTSRAYEEATDVLLRGAQIYSAHLQEAERKSAAIGLLKTRDRLANVYDILGEREAAKQQIDWALNLAEDATLGIDPLGAPVLRIRRRSAQINGDVKAEEDLLIQGRKVEPNNPDWRHSMGWFKQTHYRDCASALRQFDEAIQKEEDPLIQATYFSYQGDIHLACGEPIEAIKAYDNHIEALPEEADPYDSRAQAYIMVGRYGDARTDLNRAYERDPNLYTALLRKGNLERELGQFGDAALEYQVVLDRFGRRPNVHREVLLAQGRLALLEEKPELAKTRALEASKLEGGNRVEAFWLLGVAALAQGKREASVEALHMLEEHFAATSSKYLREYENHLRAQLALFDGRNEEALADLQAALDNHPSDLIFFLAAKAKALAQIGQTQAALDAYRKLLQINEHHVLSICAAAELSEKLSPRESAVYYGKARGILEQPSQEDPARQSCFQKAANYLGGP